MEIQAIKDILDIHDGASGTAGSSGTSFGSSGTAGSSGTSGSTGSSGTSGSTGSSGTSASSGTTGSSGTSASSGTSGTAGSSGTSGSTGSSGTSGSTGSSGTSASSGTSGLTQIASGSDFAIQYATASALGSDSRLHWNKDTGDLHIIDHLGVDSYVLLNTKTVTAACGMTTTASLQDDSNGQITILGGACRFYNNNFNSGSIYRYSMPASTGLTASSDVTSYVIADYNNGSPIYRVTSNVDEITESDIAPVFTMYYESATNRLHYINWDSIGRGLPNKLHMRLVKTNRLARESGLSLQITGSTIVVTEGRAWIGAVRHFLPALTSSQDKCTIFYHSASAWKEANVTTYNSSSYDTGTTTASLSSGRYNVNWVYRDIHDDALTPTHGIRIILGSWNEQHLTDIQAAQPPAALPPMIQSLGMLVGRIIVQQGVSTAAQVDSAFVTLFTPVPTVHNDLSGLQGGQSGEYYHLTSAELTGSGTGVFVKNISPVISSSLTVTGSFVMTGSPVPQSMSSSGVVGTFAFDNGNFYICTGSNGWIKIPSIATW